MMQQYSLAFFPNRFAVTYDVIQSSTKKEETDGINEEEEMQNTENDNSLTKMILQKGTKAMQNQKNISIQSFCCITH